MNIISKRSQKLYLSFSVDWEGEDFSGLKDLCRSRDHIETAMKREIPLTHFICPAYYTNGEPRASRRIGSVIRKDLDEIACHVHCWKSIVKEARVKFRTDHDWHTGTSRGGSGHGVPLAAYDDDIPAILQLSNRLLEHELSDEPITSFRAGGTMTNDTVFDALVANGFQTDSSAFPPSLVSKGFSPNSEGNRLDGFNEDNGLLTSYKMALWGSDHQTQSHLSNQYQLRSMQGKPVTCLTQPYTVRTQNSDSLVEIPITAGISDYVNVNQTVWPTFTRLLSKARKGEGPLFFHFGCHQEGDPKYKQPFIDFFHKLARASFQDPEINNQIEFLTVGQCRSHRK